MNNDWPGETDYEFVVTAGVGWQVWILPALHLVGHHGTPARFNTLPHLEVVASASRPSLLLFLSLFFPLLYTESSASRPMSSRALDTFSLVSPFFSLRHKPITRRMRSYHTPKPD